MLQVEDIHKSFGTHAVLRGVTFGVGGGEVVGILGANGAGKTTLLRIVNGIVRPDSGRILFDGHEATHADQARIGYLPEERGLYRHMRAGEQAVYLMRLKGMSRAAARESLHRWFDHLGMAEWWDTPVHRLSKGMQQRLQFVVTVAHGPSLVVLDEPFSGFDSQNTDMLKREIARLSDGGAAVLLSTHNLQAAAELCTKTIQL